MSVRRYRTPGDIEDDTEIEGSPWASESSSGESISHMPHKIRSANQIELLVLRSLVKIIEPMGFLNLSDQAQIKYEIFIYI